MNTQKQEPRKPSDAATHSPLPITSAELKAVLWAIGNHTSANANDVSEMMSEGMTRGQAEALLRAEFKLKEWRPNSLHPLEVERDNAALAHQAAQETADALQQELERVKAERDELLEILRPFSELLETPTEYEPDRDGNAHLYVFVQDIAKAQAAIAKCDPASPKASQD